ncbi:TraR/DksA family transcriptional regulator [Zobellella sp. DQSA1]|uniref:TraR/DksA family transcriptional regulator n=1 Tax=Zobellella sp. DQSA1 TaxID=3342386 RepID=UPI0035C0FAB2
MPTEQQHGDLKQRLLAQRESLLGEVASSRESTEPVQLDQSSVGRLSRMDAIQAQQMQQGLAGRRKEQLLRIGAALRRMENGDYGYCLGCGEDIDARRLDIDPATTLCIDCAEKRQG